MNTATQPMNAQTAQAAPVEHACAAPSGLKAGVSWALQIIAAVILAQTLFFKFSGAEEPVYIFTTLGVEPWGRIASGVFELIAAILLLIPMTAWFGAAMGIGLMVGAIGAHLGPLGIVVKDDGGLLFGLAVVVMISSVGVLVIRRAQALAFAARLGLWRAAR